MLMNIFLNTIGLQTTSPSMFIGILVAVGLIILIAVVVSSTDERKENEQKEKWIKSNSHKLKIQDDFLLKFISPLSKLTPKCNKCSNDVYNLWDITNLQLTIRCDNCKKKYNIELVEDSAIAINSLFEYVEFVQESYGHSNEKIREFLINKLSYDFSLLRSNQPLIRAIRFLTSFQEVAISSKLNFKLIGYTDYHNFNENEYFEEVYATVEDLENYFDSEEENYMSVIKSSIDNNPNTNEFTIQMPALIFGIQKQVTFFRNGIPKNEANDLDKITKKSRRISQDVKDKVWNRDGGKCVECGSNENLEFDHIIPHSKGGANTYRNIQLLCEPCNRSKSAKIG